MGLRFNGSTDWAKSSQNIYDQNNQLSLFAWFRVPNTASNSVNDRLIELGGYLDRSGAGFEFTGPTGIRAQIYRETFNYYLSVGTFTFAYNTWFCGLITSNVAGPENRVRFEADEVGQTNNGAARTASAEDFYLGVQAEGVGSSHGECDIAELCIWEGHLVTQSEYAFLLAGLSPNQIAPGSITGYWPLIDNAGPVIGTDTLQLNGTSWTGHPNITYPTPSDQVPVLRTANPQVLQR